MSIASGNLPSLGTHFSDGIRVGNVFAGDETILGGKYQTSLMAYGYTNGAPGAVISPRFFYRIKPYADNYGLFAGNNSGGYINITPTTNKGMSYANIMGNQVIKLDCPRTIKVARSASSALANVYIWGYDYGGVPMFEEIPMGTSGPTSLQAIGKKAFAYVYKVWVSQADSNWQIGVSNILGLPFYVANVCDIIACYGTSTFVTNSLITGQDLDTSAGSITADVRGTITAGTMTDLTVFTVNMYVQGADNGNTSVALLVGVPQYNQVLQ